ncbi:hypothetical protein BDW22DRAFT_1352278 [Trametopsis cervina]|nr:hypothetical protein BDW22DRAFT_1352278 [Trametopsis cervina]
MYPFSPCALFFLALSEITRLSSASTLTRNLWRLGSVPKVPVRFREVLLAQIPSMCSELVLSGTPSASLAQGGYCHLALAERLTNGSSVPSTCLWCSGSDVAL